MFNLDPKKKIVYKLGQVWEPKFGLFMKLKFMKLKTFEFEVIFVNENSTKIQIYKEKLDYRLCSHFQLTMIGP